jgi:hypothetical protein
MEGYFMSYHMKKTKLWALSTTALFLAISCGDKSSKTAAPAKAPTIEITGVQMGQGNSQILTYRADQQGVTYECKVAQGNEAGYWQPCPETGYPLPSGQGMLIVQVRAKKGDLVSNEAMKIIQGQGQGQGQGQTPNPQESSLQAVIAEKSNPGSIDPYASEIVINFSAVGATPEQVRFECKIDENQFEACTSPFRVQRQQGNQSPRKITVRPILIASNTAGLEDIILLDSSSVPVQNRPSSMPIGQLYEFAVPNGSHVTEYASVANIGGSIDAYRIRQESDPFYIGNTRCNGEFSQDFIAMSPSGQPLRYCNFTSPEEFYTFQTQARWANNHLAIATDADRILQNAQSEEHVLINLFGVNSNFKRNTTRFFDLCANRDGAIIEANNLPVMRNFWNAPVFTRFYMCTTYLNVRGPNNLPRNELFRVGAFFVSDRILNQFNITEMIDMNCGQCSYNFDHLLEVVYVARANDTNATANIFANYSMFKFQNSLQTRSTTVR